MALPENITSVNKTEYLTHDYDRQLQDLTDGTVSLIVPLNTPIRLAKVVFLEALTLNTIVTNHPTAFCTGLSDAFQITGTDRKKTIAITMNSLLYAKAITSFSYMADTNAALSADVEGTINGTGINLTLPYGTNVTGLVATFTTTGQSVVVGSTVQTSGNTANDFSSPLTYTVIAADGTTQEYTVNATPFSPSGVLDTSFNSNGFVTHHSVAGGNGNDAALDVQIDSQGRIVVAGYSDNDISVDEDWDMVIWRYNSDGTLDSSFGSAGFVFHHNAAGGDGNDMGYSLALDTTGRIIVTGSSKTSSGTSRDFAVWRYTPEGDLDTTFSDDGVVTKDGLSGQNDIHEWSPDLTIDSNGRILVVGSSNSSAGYHMVVLRLNVDGSVDNTFDSDGIVTYRNAAGGDFSDYGFAIATDSDNKIVVAGKSDSDPGAGVENYDLVVWRFNEDGSLDTGFNNVGFSIHSNAAGGDGYEHPDAIVIDGDGKILITGYSDNNSENGNVVEDRDLVIWRFNSNGTIDTAFGNNGVAIVDNMAGGNGLDVGKDILIDAYEKILVAGNSYNGTDNDLAICRFNTDGTLDTSFGTAGILSFDGGFADEAAGIAIDENGKLLITGFISNGVDNDMAIWRYK